MSAVNISGTDLMKRINQGQIQQAPLEYVEKVRGKITDACEELIDVGARIRPLFVDKRQVGWVRGFHSSERRILDRWIYSQSELALHILQLATTFTPEELREFSGLEIRSLLNVVKKMTDYDASLYSYLSAYTSTNSSENLWHAKGTQLSSFEGRIISLPDGKLMKILTASDHALFWATLCTYREQAKKRLDENFNAVLIIRPWAGKNADPIASELRGLARQMATNAVEPWQNIIQVRKEIDYSDGWAHPGDSIEDLKREMDAFIAGKDKHEQVFKQLNKQLREAAEVRQRRLEQLVQKRGGLGISNETMTILTEAEVQDRARKLREGRPA